MNHRDENTRLHDLFEKQFSEKAYLDSPFGYIETVDLIPPKLSHYMPVLLASGWGESLDLQKECVKEIYLSGRRILALRHAILIQKPKKITKYPSAELQKAETLLLFLQKKHIKKVDVISHSEGSLNLTIAATMKPNLFHNLMLITPAGVSGKDNEGRIMIGFLRHYIKTRLKTINRSHRFIGTKKQAKHLQVATLVKRLLCFKQEITALASFDIYPLLINLRQHGIKITILAGETDTVFPLHAMKRHLEKSVTQYSVKTEKEKRNYGIDLFATKKRGA